MDDYVAFYVPIERPPKMRAHRIEAFIRPAFGNITVDSLTVDRLRGVAQRGCQSSATGSTPKGEDNSIATLPGILMPSGVAR